MQQYILSYLIYLGINLQYSKIVNARISTQKLIVTRANFLRHDREEEYELLEVDFSYRKGIIGYGRWARRGNVLTVYHNEQVVLTSRQVKMDGLTILSKI